MGILTSLMGWGSPIEDEKNKSNATSKPVEEIQKSFHDIHETYYIKIAGNKLFTNKEKAVLLGVISSAHFLQQSLLNTLIILGSATPKTKVDLKEFLNESIDSGENLVLACFIMLNIINRRIKNKVEIKKMEVSIEWIISALSDVLGIDKEWFRQGIELSESSEKVEDPRDMIFTEDVFFYKDILSNTFDIQEYFTNHRDAAMRFEAATTEDRATAIKFFDAFLEKFPKES